MMRPPPSAPQAPFGSQLPSSWPGWPAAAASRRAGPFSFVVHCLAMSESRMPVWLSLPPGPSFQKSQASPPHVVHHLRGVVLVVDVVGLARRHGLEAVHAGQQAGVARADAHVFAGTTSPPPSSPRFPGCPACSCSRPCWTVSTESRNLSACFSASPLLVSVQPRHLGALEGHHLPAGDGQVAGRLRSVTPRRRPTSWAVSMKRIAFWAGAFRVGSEVMP